LQLQERSKGPEIGHFCKAANIYLAYKLVGAMQRKIYGLRTKVMIGAIFWRRSVPFLLYTNVHLKEAKKLTDNSQPFSYLIVSVLEN